MFCIHCGEELPGDANFCIKCGKPQKSGLTTNATEQGRWTTEGQAKKEAQGVSSFDAVLVSIGPNKIDVIKVVRELTELGLQESLDLVENAPALIKHGVSREEAETIRTRMAQLGANVEIR